ncbi:orf103c (mitochondrion) [Beta vulgaris subsp. vulgaris]|uniref:Orf103c protein n=3 Tax=Beta TaxID=3554 RepID=Q9MF52_BETVV|nr:orf103c [Beta vulgaris subsp. vulgaris]YP_004222332.1 hypothetical protein LKY74_mgp067 [Beta vulgaris subsp. maritima]YP_004842138.1 hypothetical protein LKY79_mgp067 [Beta macrocarpa]CBJ14063.1 hypothetical protein [Beta vulgaris subsp. maritima]CBJ17554.1 hypothetical protein [Beta vulgaris subsp. maritima]CBL51976.1 hypothetical protein [Beta vulgaris subsp. maritima]CBX24943.1 hypothetical protein [Beta macrocarpa]BAA99484.1 orf103c [Beta vulgaris subsp. vulgaris]
MVVKVCIGGWLLTNNAWDRHCLSPFSKKDWLQRNILHCTLSICLSYRLRAIGERTTGGSVKNIYRAIHSESLFLYIRNFDKSLANSSKELSYLYLCMYWYLHT